MKLTVKKGDIFSSKAQFLVNPVNCVGAMGAGLAKEFKFKFPKMFTSYKKACENRALTPGKLQIVKIQEGKFVLNFPTKNHWKDKSRLEYIEKGLDNLVSNYKEKKIQSIAFPKIGCGLGGLNWEKEVKPLLIAKLMATDINVEIWE